MIDVFAIVEDFRRRGRHGQVTFIELDRSSPDEPATALLLFADQAPAPRALVKATTNAARARRLAIEHDNLTRLEQASAALRAAIPQPLYFDRVGEATVLAQAAVAGTRIKDFPPERYFASARFREHFKAAVRWLDTFAGALGATTLSGSEAAARAAEQVARYRTRYTTSPAAGALLDEALAQLKAIGVPLTPWHGDFCTANLVAADDDRVSIIDWEYPLEPSWPLSDLLYFACSTWCVPYRKGHAALSENYRRMFFEPHGFADLLRESIRGYAARLGLRDNDLPALSAMSWVAYANRKREELDAGAFPPGVDHHPLILVRDGACSNLEILAERRGDFLASR